jgi:hypothetical protein
LVAANVTSVAVSNTTVNGVTTTPLVKVLGGGTETPTSTAVTDFAGQGISAGNAAGASTFNVPGNVNFNPATAVDRIIVSNEDPVA